jgi:hypothetical protein
VNRFSEIFKHLDSFALGVAIAVLALAMPDVVADLTRVADPESFTALLGRLWNVFVRSIIPMSIGGALGFWMLKRYVNAPHDRTFWRSIISGFSSAALLVALDRFGGFSQMPIADMMRLPILAMAGTCGVLLGHARIRRDAAVGRRIVP